MYQNLLPLWRTNEELMITAWEGLGFTNNYNLRRNSYVKGSRHYELSNHTSTLFSAGLGNVLAVVGDRKIELDERYAFSVGGGYKYENGETIYAWPSFYCVLRNCVTHLEVKDYLYGSYKSTLFRYSNKELPDGRTARKVEEYKDFPLDGPYKK